MDIMDILDFNILFADSPILGPQASGFRHIWTSQYITLIMGSIVR